MIIVGYNLSHDSSIAVIKDGEVLSALSLERLSRVKRGTVPSHVFASEMSKLTNYVFEGIGIDIKSVDHWVATSTETCDSLQDMELFSLLGWGSVDNILVLPHPNHHLAHASAAFYSSGFQKAGVLVIDAYGGRVESGRERETAFFFEQGVGPETIFQYFRPTARIAGRMTDGRLQIPTELSGVGEIYRVITLALGFSEKGTSYDDAGKTMGLAAYGKPFTKDVAFIEKKSGYLSFDKAIFSLIDLGLICQHSDGATITPYLENEPRRIRREDIAAQVQFELENACMGLAEDLVKATGNKALAASGGCFLNSVLNTKLIEEKIVDELFVFPAATDDGNAVGAALYAHYNLVKAKPASRKQLSEVYWGPKEFSNEVIEQIISKWGAAYTKHQDRAAVSHAAASAIAKGDIVGWFQGRSEFGPRSLGGRSILCHPGITGMKNRLNQRVKFREKFRPFAASVLEEEAALWFQMPSSSSPFMLNVCRVLEQKSKLIGEIVHVDGSCRIQTVGRKNSSSFRALLEEFNNITGVPLLINTSFNLRGMPIIEKPEEALDCLYGSRLDRVFLNDFEVFLPAYENFTPVRIGNLEEDHLRHSQDMSCLQLLNHIDGESTVLDIARTADVEIENAYDMFLELRHIQKIDWKETPNRPIPSFIGLQYEPSEN